MGQTDEKFNKLIEEIKGMFVVSQAIAKNSFFFSDKNDKLREQIKDLDVALSHIKEILKAAIARPNEIAEDWKEHLASFIEQQTNVETEPKFCICCEEITEENAHLHRNCGK